jgi:prepilin-type processing-associated H-X9-DG protein
LLTDGATLATSNSSQATSWSIKPAAWLLGYPNDGQTNSSGNPHWGGPCPRHLETTNVGFADGHVKAMRVEKFYYADSPYLDPARGG